MNLRAQPFHKGVDGRTRILAFGEFESLGGLSTSRTGLAGSEAQLKAGRNQRYAVCTIWVPGERTAN